MLSYALRFMIFDVLQKCDFHLNAMLRIKIFEIFDSISYVFCHFAGMLVIRYVFDHPSNGWLLCHTILMIMVHRILAINFYNMFLILFYYEAFVNGIRCVFDTMIHIYIIN